MTVSIRPRTGELAEARGIVETASDAVSRQFTQIDHAVSIELGWSSEPPVSDRYGGAISSCQSPTRLTILFTTEPTDWTEALYRAVARGLGRSWLLAQLPDERVVFRWQAILREAAGISVSEAVAPAGPAPWSTVDQLRTEWPTLQEELDLSVTETQVTDSESPWVTLTDPLSGLGAAVATERNLETLPDLTHSDVIATLETAFEPDE